MGSERSDRWLIDVPHEHRYSGHFVNRTLTLQTLLFMKCLLTFLTLGTFLTSSNLLAQSTLETYPCEGIEKKKDPFNGSLSVWSYENRKLRIEQTSKILNFSFGRHVGSTSERTGNLLMAVANSSEINRTNSLEIIFTDSTVYSFPDVMTDIGPDTRSSGFSYHALVRLTNEEVELLKTKRVTLYRINGIAQAETHKKVKDSFYLDMARCIFE